VNPALPRVKAVASPVAKKSMELVGKEAYELAANLIKQDMGFREEESAPNFAWTIGIAGLPAAGWEVEEAPDLSIYDWNTGKPVQRYAVMKETARTAASIEYSWTWSVKDVPCGVYVGVVNYKIKDHLPVIGNTVHDRLQVFFQREKGRLIKTHKTIPWD
jgi:hypothetical protein